MIAETAKTRSFPKIVHSKGKVIVSIDMEKKNFHQFENSDIIIRLERKYDNFNMRYTHPSNATIVSAEHIPQGADVLIHHNCTHDSYRLFHLLDENGNEFQDELQYYSIDEKDCYLWRLGKDEYQPCNGYETALRLFEPYKGVIEGIEPTLVQNKLYITSGYLKGKVCDVIKHSDYEIIYQGDDNREKRVVRIRLTRDGVEPIEFDKTTGKYNMPNEAIAIDHYATKQVEKGELYVGLEPKNAKNINEWKQ